MMTRFAEVKGGSRKTREKIRKPKNSQDRGERIVKGVEVGAVMDGSVGFVEMISGLKLRVGCFRLVRSRS